jgi:streptogramin lyase
MLATSAAAVGFPPATVQFLNVHTGEGIPALHGGIWVNTSQGIVHYAEGGAGATLPTPGGGAPRNLVLAADGSIWFSADALIGRISPQGTMLEQYSVPLATALAVASDGAVWYTRESSIVGRIGGGVATEFSSPTDVQSLAAANNGQIWLLGSGFGTSTDNLYRMTPTGAVSVLPLGHDVLFGRLQALPDGTLYIGTGIRYSVLRLVPGALSVEVVKLPGSEYLADSYGNLWTGGYGVVGYISRTGATNLSVRMPVDPRALLCINIPAYKYQPIAIDSNGGVWVRIFDDAMYIGEVPPCEEPEPPPMPTLIRIDVARFLSANDPGSTRRRAVVH